MASKTEPRTVFPAQGFSALRDAKDLRKAMKGLGTNEQVVIDTLTRRSNDQRQEIISAFKKEFGRDLISDLKSELSGNFERVILSLMETLPGYLASELHIAMKGAGTDEDTLAEIIVSQPNRMLKEIKKAYQIKYGKTLEEHIGSEVSGHYKRLLFSILTCSRNEKDYDQGMASEMAKRLYSAGEKRLGTDEETFISILANESPKQIRLISEEYGKLSKKTLANAINSEFSGDIKNALLAILKCAESRARFWAEHVNESMKGLGTKDSKLIRILVSRCEIDLETIKHEYKSLYNKALYSDVKSETSGDYGKTLLALIGDA